MMSLIDLHGCFSRETTESSLGHGRSNRDFQKRITGLVTANTQDLFAILKCPQGSFKAVVFSTPTTSSSPSTVFATSPLQSITSLVLSLDIDFLPSFRAHSILTSKPYLSLLTNTTFPATIILPAFEFINTPRKPFPILTLDYLRSSCLTSSILPFHAQPLPHQPSPNTRPFCSGNTTSPPTHKITSAHLATNYQEFFTQNATPVPYPALLPLTVLTGNSNRMFLRDGNWCQSLMRRLEGMGSISARILL
ncbi:hypothetical protein BC829DRAFT_174314 [Chytridium lagenaria]|nr:hypothetical protein BC829DRAFT_174314 [Chytridium lagenaria]